MSISDNFPAPESDFSSEIDNEWGELLNAAEEQETETGEGGIFSRPLEDTLEAESGETQPITPGKDMGESAEEEERPARGTGAVRLYPTDYLGRLPNGKFIPKFSRSQDTPPIEADFQGDGEEPIPLRARRRSAKVQQALRLFLYGRTVAGRGYTVTGAAREVGANQGGVFRAIREDGVMEFRREMIERRSRAIRARDEAEHVHIRDGLPALLARYKEANSLISRLPITSKAFRDALSAEKSLRLAIDALSGAEKTPVRASKQPATPPPASELPPPPPSWG